MGKPQSYDYVIIGGGVAGVTAAEEIRARDQHGSILIISQELEPLYSRVLLPHYVRRRIVREKVFLREFKKYEHERITLFSGEEVVGFDPSLRVVITSQNKSITYGKLLISTGGVTASWNVPGADNDRVLRLQTIKDADHAHEILPLYSKKEKPRAMVIGGSFISLEFLESAMTYGYEVDLILKDKQFFADVLDEGGWKMLSEYMRKSGITIHALSELRKITPTEDGRLEIATTKAELLSVYWIGIGIGIVRNLEPFRGTGIKIGRGIRVNQYLESSLPNVWAAGDIAEAFDTVLGEEHLVGNWTNAVLHGKIAGANMAGDRKPVHTVSTYSISALGLHFTFVGKTNFGQDADSVVRTWPDTFGYERIFFKDGVIQGAMMMNRFQDKPAIAALIESKKNLTAVKDALGDPYADIKTLL